MAHFAKLNDNNEVISVHCVNNNVLDPQNEEKSGIEFLTNLHNHDLWKQTSYNNKIRKQYAGIGFTYDPINDVFIAPQPYASWNLNNNFEWEAPISKPEGKGWFWSEKDLNWLNANQL